MFLTREESIPYSKKLAIGFGLFLAVVEVFYNWENPSWWPFILVDYVAVALLLYGAVRSNTVLLAGWGFTCAMFYMSFFMSFELGQSTPVIAAKGILFSATIAGLVLALRGFQYGDT